MTVPYFNFCWENRCTQQHLKPDKPAARAFYMFTTYNVAIVAGLIMVIGNPFSGWAGIN